MLIQTIPVQTDFFVYTRGSKTRMYLRITREAFRNPNAQHPLLITSEPLGMELGISSSKLQARASLVAQWLRIHLLMQGTWVQALVQEDPTCHGATKPVCHNY